MSKSYLFVDELSGDKKYGITNNPKMVAYNISTFGKPFVKYIDNLIKDADIALWKFIPAGRYLVLLKILVNKEYVSMEFNDIGKWDKSSVAKLILRYQKEYGELFDYHEMWNELCKMKNEFSYLFNKDTVELIPDSKAVFNSQ